MKILVLGASGRTGSIFTRKALEAGHIVTTYVRNPDKALTVLGAHPNLHIVPGSLQEVQQLTRAAEGQDVLVCTIGQSGRPRDFLSTRFMQDLLPGILRAGTVGNVPHCIILSAYGVGNTAKTASLPMRIASKTIMRAVFRDKEKADEAIAYHNHRISRAYPGVLTDGPGTGAVKTIDINNVVKVPGIPRISRTDVADALLMIAAHPAHAGTNYLVTVGDADTLSPSVDG